MKNNKKLSVVRIEITRLFLFLLIIVQSTSAYAQSKISGKISNEKGEALKDVNIKLKGTSLATISDRNGLFELTVPNSNQTLEFSYTGFLSQQISLNGRNTISVVLKESTESIEDVVVVGYGTQKKMSVTGAISSISGKEILKAPSVGITNVLGARVAGVTMLQTTGQPGYDAASLLIRGQSAVYIVDGIERSINEIDPNEIESISVLKDATSAAVYGLNASAVVIVTTKRGSAGKMNINYTGKYGTTRNANQLDWLDGPSYAYWYNKTREMDGDTPLFTSEQVQKMIDGVDGWANTRWYDEVFDVGTNQHHNISANGGNDKSKFFTSVGAFNQKGNVDRHDFKRYNLRTNIDAKITNNVTLELGIGGRLEDRSTPRYPADPDQFHNIPLQAVRALPYLPIKTIFEGNEYYISSPTGSSPVSPIASINNSGYSRYNSTFLQSNFSLKYDVHGVEGLSMKFTGGYDMSYQFHKGLGLPFETILASYTSPTTEKLIFNNKLKDDGGNTTLNQSASRSTNVVTQTSINFDRTFGKHTINALALAESRNNFGNSIGGIAYGLDFIELDEWDNISNKTGAGQEKIPNLNGRSNQSRLVGFVGRLNYDFSNKYLAEFTYRRDGSYLFSGKSGSRWVDLPAVSLGWRLDQEDWFESEWVNNLKIRGGVGKSATSGVSAFQYLNSMGIQTNAVVIGGSSQSMLFASTLGNPNLGWAKAINYNLGFDFNTTNRLIGLELDFFYKYEYDLLTSVSGSYPPSVGGYFFTVENKNKIDYRGFDFTLSHNNNIGEFQYGVKFLGTLAKRRWLLYAGDSENTPDYRKLTGKEVGAQLGFIAEGLFQTQEEIDNSPIIEGAPVLPGYIKYKDRNGDGKIDYQQDMGYVGKSAYPRFQSSVNLTGAYKGFDFDLLFQSAFGRTVALTGVYTLTGSQGVMDATAFTRMFYGGGNSPVFLPENSWTPENPNAEFPRLSMQPSINGYSSTHWYKSGDYLRLKTAQLGYTLPTKLMNSIGFSGMRIYAEGSNLFTVSELTKFNIDPEQPGVNNGYYPQQKTYTFGINLIL